MIYRDRDKNLFIKSYELSSLVGDKVKIHYRLSLVKTLSPYFIDFKWLRKTLIVESTLIHGKHKTQLSFEELVLLAEFLDKIHSSNLVHGDIHFRNILVKEGYPFLIDWEPCFIQLVNSKRLLKVNSKGIALQDKFDRKITCLTDKKNFLKLISEKIFNEYADTETMKNLSCLDLLQLNT